MREMWQLPKRSVWARLRKFLTIAGLIWAVAAVPLTLWLSARNPTPPPAAPWRELTSTENAAVRYGAQVLRTEPVSLTSTVTSPMAQLKVEETVDPVRGISTGVVRSGAHTADLLAVAGRVLLRGGPDFWSTLGVPTADPGWVDVGDRLGVRVTFPLDQAAAAMVPGAQMSISTTTDSSTSSVIRNDALNVVFGSDGISAITLSERTANVSRPSGDALTRLAATPPPGWDATVAVLTGTGGALTVTPPTPPPPGAPSETPPPPAP